MNQPASTAIRVERGQASEEELAAVTALLLARAQHTHRSASQSNQPGGSGTSAPRATKARWRRLERQHGFRAAHSWQG